MIPYQGTATMRDERKWEPVEFGWPEIPPELNKRARLQWHLRFDRDLKKLLQNEAATKKFLAEVVYDVPEDLLDDVLRIRLAELL